MNASEAISPAYERTKQMLFQPFDLVRWLKLAFVVLCAGQVATLNFSFNPPAGALPQGTGPMTGNLPDVRMPGIFEAIGIAAVVAILLFLVAMLVLVGLYIWSRSRFMLMDCVLEGDCRVRDFWRRNADPGTRLFGWMLLINGLMIAGVFAFIGGPILALMRGGQGGARQNGAALIAAILASLGAIFMLTLLNMLVTTFIKDFVVPVMAFERLPFSDACGRVWNLTRNEPGSFVLYILLKVVLVIATGIMCMIMLAIAMIPVVIACIIAVIAFAATFKSMGPASVIALVFTAVLVGLPIVLYVLGLFSVPFAVFLQAYALYFFAGRYSPLARVLTPPPVIPVVPADSVQPPPANEPPPLPA